MEWYPNRGRTTEEEASLPRSVYFGDHYFSSDQLTSLSKQIRLVHAMAPKRILEIGKGSGFVASFLANAGYDVTTLDINPHLQPNVVGNVLNADEYFRREEFDLAFCAEVLEHLPFQDVRRALEQIRYTARKHVIISLPRSQRILFDFQYFFKLPCLKRFQGGLYWAVPRRRERILNHHWELDCRSECSMNAVKELLQHNFKILKVEREKLNPYHYFFVLECR